MLALCLITGSPAAEAQLNEPIDIQTAAHAALQQGRLYELITALQDFVAHPPANLPVRERVTHLMDLVELYGIEAHFVGRLARGDIDVLSEALYQEAIRLAPPELRAEVENDYAYYLNVTNRTGRALMHFRAVLRDPHADAAPDLQYVALGQIAAAYMDMGASDYAGAALARARAIERRFDEPARTILHLSMSTLEMGLALDRGDHAAISALWRADRRLLSSNALQASDRVGAAIAYLLYLNKIDDRQGAAEAEAFIRAHAVEGLAGDIRNAPRAVRRRFADTLIDCIIYTLAGNPLVLARDSNYRNVVAACDEFTRSLPFLAGQLQLTRGRVLELQGHDAAALEVYRGMIEQAEGARGTYEVEHRGDFFSGRWRAAYEGVERIHARAFRREPASVYSFFSLLGAVDRRRARQFSDLRHEASEAQTPQSLLALAQSLEEGAAVVVLSMHDNELISLGFTRTLRAASTFDGSISVLNERVNLVRGLLQDADSDLAQIGDLMDALSADALGSVRPMLAGARRVIVIADGPLARVPFALFTAADRAAPIGVQAEVSYALSVRALHEQPRAARGEGLFAAGAPAYPTTPPAAPLDDGIDFQARRVSEFSGRVDLETLPFARRELVALAVAADPNAGAALADRAALGYRGLGVRLLLGQAASETAVRDNLQGARYIHIASHGLLAGDFGLTEPALVLSADDREDGFLTASEVARLRIEADLTVLSSCSSGDGRIASGEGVLGLARAFLIAGSDEVLVSMWPVNDAATAQWMSSFYRRLRAGAAAQEALRLTMAEMRESYPEPKYWAPFVLVRG